MDDLFRDNILDHYRNPRNFGRLTNPDFTWEEINMVCGDKIGIELSVDSGQSIKEIKFFGEGCAISMASASMLTEFVKGKKIEELKKITPSDIQKMVGIELTPTRLKCALLSLETLHKTIGLVGSK